MLVISRKRGQQFVIGGTDGQPLVVVVVNKIKGDRVSLGVIAPAEVKVVRSELLTKGGEK